MDPNGGENNYGDDVEQLNIEIDNGSLQQEDMMEQNDNQDEDPYDEQLEQQVESRQS